MSDDFRDHVLELWTSNSWRRFCARNGGDRVFVCEPTVQRFDNHPDLHFPGGFDGPAARRFLATWNACKGIATDTLEEETSIAHTVLRSIGMKEALRDIERRALALAESIATGETSEQMRDQARAIAAKCAAALAGK